jgi:DNA polymerase III delta subunit
MDYSVTDMIQNLEDAGCESDTITAFVDDMKKGKTAESIKLLNRHRQSLLDILHSYQRQIDCLDYLIYQIKKQR